MGRQLLLDEAQLSNTTRINGSRAHRQRVCYSSPCRYQHCRAGLPRLSGACGRARATAFQWAGRCLRAGGCTVNREHGAVRKGRTYRCMHMFPTTNPLVEANLSLFFIFRLVEVNKSLKTQTTSECNRYIRIQHLVLMLNYLYFNLISYF